MIWGTPHFRKLPSKYIAGWWFGTCFIFPYIGNNNPNWLIFFRGVGQPPTRLYMVNQWVFFVGGLGIAHVEKPFRAATLRVIRGARRWSKRSCFCDSVSVACSKVGDLQWGFIMAICIYIYTHRIHGAGIYANIGGILMVNVTIYSIHGSYGYIICNPGLMCFSFETSQNLTFENLEIEVCGSTSPLTYWWQKDANPRATFKVQADGPLWELVYMFSAKQRLLKHWSTLNAR